MLSAAASAAPPIAPEPKAGSEAGDTQVDSEAPDGTGDAAADHGDHGDHGELIERSLHYFKLRKAVDRAEAALADILEFAKKMPTHKHPTAEITRAEKAVERSKKRLENYQSEFIRKRAAAAANRSARHEAEKLEKAAWENLPDKLKSAINKRMNKHKILAARAARAALEANASSQEAFQKFGEVFKTAFDAPMELEAGEAGDAGAEADESDDEPPMEQ